jgi:hypothetical protein
VDNQGTMDISTINRLVGGQQEASGIYHTIEACNSGGSISPNYEVEELEELEARGLNPYWDNNVLRKKLKTQAQKNGVWFEKSYLDNKTLLHDQKSTGTSENDMYLDANGKTVTKLNNLSYVKGAEYYHNLFAVVDRLESHNSLFPDVAYLIKGFMENKNGFPALVLQQSYVNSVERNATKEEIEIYLTSKGFTLTSSRNWSNGHKVWSNGVFELFDARPANVLKGFDGQLYFVDTFPHSVQYMR